MLTAVTGINWGDEGKGRVIDLLAGEADVVVRYQGGNNAGHTVVADQGKFILNLIPSGILHDGVTCVLGDGMVVDLEHLEDEIAKLRQKGVSVSPKNLKISKRATISMPWHRIQDELEEDRLAKSGSAFGSTRRGIAYAYSDKYRKKTLRMGDLLRLDEEGMQARLKMMLDAKNMELAGCYHQEPMSFPALLQWCNEQAEKFAEYICDTGAFLEEALQKGRKVILEAQLGAMRDIDYGIFPYTSSSSTSAAYAPSGAGIPAHTTDHVVGVLKAYSTCVGEGPFTAEWFGEEAEQLRVAGGEYGASTGRPRRVGPIDLVATRYGVEMQGATSIALTKLDVLSYMDKIPLCAHYEIDGVQTDDFPFPILLDRAKPVMEYMPGWQCDISGARRWEDLPEAARSYVEYVEKAIGCPIGYVSVGAERESLILR